MSQLQLTGFAKPFFIQYRIEDVDDFDDQGGVWRERGRRRTATSAWRASRCAWATTRPTARAGAAMARWSWRRSTTIRLRCARRCGLATDQAYKSALAAYAQKQAALKQVQTPPQADDFSQEKPVISLADPAQLSCGRGRVGGARGAGQRALSQRRERQGERARCAVLDGRVSRRA